MKQFLSMKRCIYLIMMFLCSTLVYGKQLTIGILVTPPYASYSGTNKSFFGFTIDLIDNICQQMNTQCIYKPIPLNGDLNEVLNGTVDLAFTQIPITKDSTGKFIFSLPYLISDAQFAALSDSTINTVAEIKDKRIGVLSATLQQVLDESKYDDGKIKLYDNFADLLIGLSNHEVDVIFINNHVAQYIINNESINIKLIGTKIPIGEGYGILGLKSNKNLINKVNAALLKMENDGTYLKIYEVYFGNSN